MSDEIRDILAELDAIILYTIMDALDLSAQYESDKDVIVEVIVNHAFDSDLDVDDIREAVQEAAFTCRQEYDDSIEDLADEVMEELHPHF